MNKKRFLYLVVFLIVTSFSTELLAQKKSNKKANPRNKKEVGPPPWAPAHGYRAKSRYVYFTEHNFYYDNNKGVYIYLSGKNWEVSAQIPDLFRHVNLAAEVKIDLDFSEDNPQKFNADHRKKYRRG